MSETKQHALAIFRLPDGGYVVSDAYIDSAFQRQPMFCSTTIEEALKYIRDKLTPVGAA